MTLRRLATAVLSVLVTACASSGAGVVSPEDVLLRPARTSFAAGESMDLEFWNRSDQALGYNACSGLILERRSGGDVWERVSHQPPGSACTLELTTMAPGASTLVRIPPPASLAPGAYRVRMHVEWPLGNGRVELRTTPFQVGR